MLLIMTTIGLTSLAYASKPSRWASSGSILLSYKLLVQRWPEIALLAGEARSTAPGQPQLFTESES